MSRCCSDGLKSKTFYIKTPKEFTMIGCVPFSPYFGRFNKVWGFNKVISLIEGSVRLRLPTLLRFSALLRVLKRMAPKGVQRTQDLLPYNKSERKFNEMQYNTEKKKACFTFLCPSACYLHVPCFYRSNIHADKHAPSHLEGYVSHYVFFPVTERKCTKGIQDVPCAVPAKKKCSIPFLSKDKLVAIIGDWGPHGRFHVLLSSSAVQCPHQV